MTFQTHRRSTCSPTSRLHSSVTIPHLSATTLAHQRYRSLHPLERYLTSFSALIPWSTNNNPQSFFSSIPTIPSSTFPRLLTSQFFVTPFFLSTVPTLYLCSSRVIKGLPGLSFGLQESLSMDSPVLLHFALSDASLLLPSLSSFPSFSSPVSTGASHPWTLTRVQLFMHTLLCTFFYSNPPPHTLPFPLPHSNFLPTRLLSCFSIACLSRS